MEKVLVSACFLGQAVRYDGGHQQLKQQCLARWQKQGRLIALCPEVAGGLPVPRPPAEIERESGKVFTQAGADVSQAFHRGAEQALALCQQHQIRYALLKESSPSCGSQQVYDGCFKQVKIAGQGVTTALLRQHGIEVFSENTIDQLALLLD